MYKLTKIGSKCSEDYLELETDNIKLLTGVLEGYCCEDCCNEASQEVMSGLLDNDWSEMEIDSLTEEQFRELYLYELVMTGCGSGFILEESAEDFEEELADEGEECQCCKR